MPAAFLSRRSCARLPRRLAILLALWMGAGSACMAGPDLASPELRPVSQAGVQQALTSESEERARGSMLAAAVADAKAVRADITQAGSGNQASVTQSGRALTLALEQSGNNNTIVASQTGQLASLDISQQGNGNRAVFNQTGAVRAALVQVGDMHRADITQSAASPNITIHQSGSATVVQTTQY